MRKCKECGLDISSRHGLAKYCKTCSPLIKKRQDKEYEERRKGRRLKYYKYYNKNGRKGTGNIGCHIFKDENGKIDFERERDIVHKEKIFLFKKINLFRKIVHRDYFYSFEKKDADYRCHVLYVPLMCDGCIIGRVVIPEIPRSSDYNEDGLVMPFCMECGIVYD